MFICASLCTFYSNEMYNNEASYRTFIIKICMSNDMLVFALLCHMTYIFKKCPSKNINTNPSNLGPDGKLPLNSRFFMVMYNSIYVLHHGFFVKRYIVCHKFHKLTKITILLSFSSYRVQCTCS